MTQRKLTDDEMDNVMVARGALRRIRQSFDSPDCLRDTAIHLGQLALHATTDGKPYVDPEPPILDGYRLAVAGDEGRSDIEIWNADRKKWCVRANDAATGFSDWYHYIVPADRTPTDEDAKSRPEVAVRDGSEPWQKAVLYGVLPDNAYSFLVVSQGTSGRFKYARHLYPDE